MIMKSINRHAFSILLSLMLTALMTSSAQAHLMVAQHGTLNFVDEGAFMVLSLPMSAFEDIDDDGDGKVSMIEFNNHRAGIVEAIGQSVTLGDEKGNLSLQDIMLSPVVAHDASDNSIEQLTILGRFALAGAKAALRFQVDLFGKQSTEQLLKITATRQSDKRELVFELTPVKPAGMLFADTDVAMLD
jgi:hypothetical protein